METVTVSRDDYLSMLSALSAACRLLQVLEFDAPEDVADIQMIEEVAARAEEACREQVEAQNHVQHPPRQIVRRPIHRRDDRLP